jgi:large conductance mechanosensitive channel
MRMKGFRDFLLRSNVIALAVAVVMGVAFTDIVRSLVDNIITPLIAAAGGQPHFGSLVLTIGHTAIKYGLFLNAVIAFIIVAAVVYFLLVAPMTKMIAFSQRKKDAVQRECPECLSSIPFKATRCMYCTAAVPPAKSSVEPVS